MRVEPDRVVRRERSGHEAVNIIAKTSQIWRRKIVK
jgi:hypothetical protein